MSQLNIQMTPEFEQNLVTFMAMRGIKTKSDAVRRAVEEALTRSAIPVSFDWSVLRGKGLGASSSRFHSNDELWEKP